MNMNSNFGELVLEVATRVIQRKQATLAEVGLRAEVRLSVWNEARGEQEVRLEFLREDQLTDVLEDIITRDGKPVASLEEVEEWIEQGIATIASEQSHDIFKGFLSP